MKLEPINYKSFNTSWDDKIDKFVSWRVYHTSAWLDFIEKTQPAKRRFYAIYSGDVLVGLIPGFIFRKGPFSIYGSPFAGWTTMYLGPLINDDIDQAELFRLLAKRLQADGIVYAEFRNPMLDTKCALKYGFRARKMSTYAVDLKSNPEEIFADFNRSCRKAIKKAQRNGLQVMTTKDPRFIDIYYQQLKEVFAKDGLIPTYPKSRVEALWQCLMPVNRLIATWVLFGDKIIATRLDICGKEWLHSFGSASSIDYLKLYPNELARFHVMSLAAARGLKYYDMSGAGSYKAKFGAREISVDTIFLGAQGFVWARDLFQRLHRLKVKYHYREAR